MVELTALTSKLFTQNRALNESVSDVLYSVRSAEDHRLIAKQLGDKTSELTHLAFRMHRWSKGMVALDQEQISHSESNTARRLCSDGYFLVRAISHMYLENCEEDKIFSGRHKPLNHAAADKMTNLFDDLTRKIKEIRENA